MKFYYPYLLFLLFLIPALVLFYIYVYNRKRKDYSILGQIDLLNRLSNYSFNKQKIKSILLTLSFMFIILSLARPQFGTKLLDIKQHGADVVIAVDVSSSMLAGDIQPNRLNRAKLLLSNLALQLKGNRIGIIAFAGTAFWQCPLTLDIASVNLFLQIMDTNLIPLPGTAIGKAIRLAVKGLSKTPPKSKAIVLLTDGEDHDSDPQGAADEASKQGIKIFTIGFGNPLGEPIPFYDEQGNFSGYKKDKKGNVIMSKLDEPLLNEISSSTGGTYFKSQQGEINITRLVDEIQGLEKQKLSSNVYRQYEDRYQYFLFLGLLLLFIELLIPETKKLFY